MEVTDVVPDRVLPTRISRHHTYSLETGKWGVEMRKDLESPSLVYLLDPRQGGVRSETSVGKTHGRLHGDRVKWE